MNREQLISLCERAIVDVSKWSDRDSPSAQCKTGECWALLKANCEFEYLIDGSLFSDERTVWIKIWHPDFSNMEDGIDCDDKKNLHYEHYYLPTEKRLSEANNNDWY